MRGVGAKCWAAVFVVLVVGVTVGVVVGVLTVMAMAMAAAALVVVAIVEVMCVCVFGGAWGTSSLPSSMALALPPNSPPFPVPDCAIVHQGTLPLTSTLDFCCPRMPPLPRRCPHLDAPSHRWVGRVGKGSAL